MLSDQELERRKPVWKAFSEFFLDTRLTGSDVERIARIARASGYSLAELRDIYLCEVAPAVGLNLWSIAGEWAGFEEQWLYERAARHARHRSLLVRSFAFLHRRLWWLTWLGDRDWHRMVRQLDRL